jgi:pimeloyl-ACP methyl ester carboxylesterase
VMHDPAKARRTAERALRTKTVVLYPDASHAINGEYPERIADDLRTFLAAHDR